MSKKEVEETFFQKEKRLKSRKQSFKTTYKKGVYYANHSFKNLIEYINQPDVLVSVQSTGTLDDDTAFIQITIEGLTPKEDGI